MNQWGDWYQLPAGGNGRGTGRRVVSHSVLSLLCCSAMYPLPPQTSVKRALHSVSLLLLDRGTGCCWRMTWKTRAENLGDSEEAGSQEIGSNGRPGGVGRMWMGHPRGMGFKPTFTSVFAKFVI